MSHALLRPPARMRPPAPMLFVLVLLLTSLAPAPTVAQERGSASPDTTWTVFEPGTISNPDIRETSPSITADGQTMVFARTENWKDKEPYIATRSDDGWNVHKAPFADTLYNLAIAPDRQSVFFKKDEMEDGEEVSRAYRVQRTSDGWGTPQNLPLLFNTNAGYFCPMADGTLYFFGRIGEKKGIFRTEPDGNGGYTTPQ